MNNRVYDGLKWTAQIFLPALATFTLTVGPLWELPNAMAVGGTITAIDTLLGAILGLTKRAYDNSDEKYDGAVDISLDEENQATDLNFRLSPDTFASNKKEVVLRLNHQ